MPTQKKGDKPPPSRTVDRRLGQDPIDPALSGVSVHEGERMRKDEGEVEVEGGVDRPVQVQGRGHREVVAQGQERGQERGYGRIGEGRGGEDGLMGSEVSLDGFFFRLMGLPGIVLGTNPPVMRTDH